MRNRARFEFTCEIFLNHYTTRDDLAIEIYPISHEGRIKNFFFFSGVRSTHELRPSHCQLPKKKKKKKIGTPYTPSHKLSPGRVRKSGKVILVSIVLWD